MAAWIASLREAALERREGVAPERVLALPRELAALYGEMNGATLLGEVRLFPLEESPFPREGEGSWRFGQKGSHQHLLALPKRTVAEALAGAAEPSWLPEVGEGEWIYGVKEGSTGPLRLFRTLETMLGVLIPPPKEEFGEQTYARAVAAVHETLAGVTAKEALRSAPEETVSEDEVTPSVANPLPPEAFADEEVAEAPKQAAGTKRGGGTARKPPKKGPAQKKPAAKKAAPKQGVARKPAPKRSAAKTSVTKRSPRKKVVARKPAKAAGGRKSAKAKTPARKSAKKVPSRKAARSQLRKSVGAKRGRPR